MSVKLVELKSYQLQEQRQTNGTSKSRRKPNNQNKSKLTHKHMSN